MTCWLDFFNVSSLNATFVGLISITPSLLDSRSSLCPFSVLNLVKSILIDLIPSLSPPFSMLLLSDYAIDQMFSLLSACRELPGSVMCQLVAILEIFIS